MHISFGSDGFRGVIGANFTRESVWRIAQAAAEFCLQKATEKTLAIPVGFDSRFLSREMAQVAAAAFAEQGLQPLVATRPCPSPYLSFAANRLGAPLGLQVTASHNPYFYNGVKLKSGYGGSMLASDVAFIEALASRDIPLESTASARREFAAQPASLDEEYAEAIRSASGIPERLQQAVAVDYMHGAGSGIYREVLQSTVRLEAEFRTEKDPLFAGSKPEPLEPNLSQLQQYVRERAGSGIIGLAFDGDGDRLAVIDETGQYLATHEIFCLLIELLAADAKPDSVVVTTVSFSGLVNRVAEAAGLLVYEVPVGFKHVTEAMLQFDALIGGEESGGAGIGAHLPERDALLMALLLLRYRQQKGASLHDLVQGLYARHGRPCYLHKDYQLPLSTDMDRLRLQIRELASMERLAGDEVQSLNHRDGMKLRTDSGWALARASGTEPLLRIYAEGPSIEQAEAYAAAVLKRLGQE